MKKNIFLLILLANSSLLAMEAPKLNIEVPARENRYSAAQDILAHAGYVTGDVHLKAILYAFEKMTIKPMLVRPDIEAGEASHTALTPFDHAKLHWYSYAQKKNQELAPIASTSKVRTIGDASSKNSAASRPSLAYDAQQLIPAALEYYVNYLDNHATIKTSVGFAVGTLGVISLVLIPLLTKYLTASCTEHSGS